MLIALGASIELRLRDACRTLALEDFFLGYGRQDRAPGEILTRITVPRLGQDEHFRCYKISKRFDQDISALLGAFRFRIHRGRVVEARIAYGGMAATAKRAPAKPSVPSAGLRLRDPVVLVHLPREVSRGGLLPHRRPPCERPPTACASRVPCS